MSNVVVDISHLPFAFPPADEYLGHVSKTGASGSDRHCHQ